MAFLMDDRPVRSAEDVRERMARLRQREGRREVKAAAIYAETRPERIGAVLRNLVSDHQWCTTQREPRNVHPLDGDMVWNGCYWEWRRR